MRYLVERKVAQHRVQPDPTNNHFLLGRLRRPSPSAELVPRSGISVPKDDGENLISQNNDMSGVILGGETPPLHANPFIICL